MKKFVKGLSLLLIIGHFLSEAHSVVYKIWPQSINYNVDWFWKKGYSYLINILWYLKISMDDLLLVVSYFVMAKISFRYSYKLFLVVCVYFFYHVIDIVMFHYNFKSTPFVNWLLLSLNALAILFLILPMKKQESKYISMV